MKNVIVVSSTPRRGGNSLILAKSFIDGAMSAGNQAELIEVNQLNIKFCTGCFVCQTTDKCVLNDEMNALYKKIQNADVLVFATPIYYYCISGQLKTFLDRLNPLYTRDNKFKEVYLLATAADTEKFAMDGAIKALQGWIDCFDCTLKGEICGVGVNDEGEILNTPFVKQAFDMGANI